MKLLVYGLCLAPVLALGQDDAIEDEFALLEEALSVDEVESASKHRQSIMWSPSAITVLTRDDIRASGATSVPELLRRVPGMDIIKVKSSYTLVGARSQTDEYNNLVLLLVDGREEMLELTGFAFWNVLSIDLEEIERVEIIRGPGSALYGANAFSAVVNITTSRERLTGGADVYLSGAESGRQRLHARMRNHHSLGTGKLSYSLAFGREGELSPSGKRETGLEVVRSHGYLRLQLPGKLDASLHGGLVSGRTMISMFMGDLQGPELFFPWLMGQAELSLGESTRIKAQFYYNRYYVEMKARADIRAYGVWLANIPELTWDSDTIDGQLQLETNITDEILLISGANLRYSTLAGTNFILNDDDELRGAGFAQLNWTLIDEFQLTGGIRLDLSELTGLAPSPRLAAVYRPAPEYSLRLGYGLAFRKPSFFEARVHLNIEDYNVSVPEIVDLMGEQLGNPDVQNEIVHTLEAGFRGHLLDNRLKISLDLYYSRYLDIIHLITIVPQSSFGLPDIAHSDVRFRNQGGTATAAGGELHVGYSPDEIWHLWINLVLRYSTRGNPAHPLPKEPAFKANLGARYLPESGLIADLALHAVSDYAQRKVDPANILAKSTQPMMGDQLLLVGRLAYRMQAYGSDFDTGITIRAPLTENLREFPGTPMPLWLGSELNSDFQGERFDRQVSAYLRASF